MKRIVLALLILVAAGAALPAGDIYVPDNNPATGSPNSWPFSSKPDWRYHLLIDAKFLGGKPFQITDIGIAPTTTATPFTATQFQVRMAHTTAGTLSSLFAQNLGSNPVVLYDGPISFPSQKDTWCDMGLTGTFSYDGTRNLVIEVRYQGGSKNVRVHTDAQLERCYTHSSNSNDPYNDPAAIWPVPGPMMGMKLHIKTQDTLIVGSGTGQVGTAVDFLLKAPTDPNLPYQVGTALGNGPTPLGSRQIGLSLDDLLVVTVGNLLPVLFQNYTGLLDTQGDGKARLVIPGDSRLAGLSLYSAFVTVNASAPLGIQSISNTFDFKITP